jgi:hypothetical protein
VENEQFTGRWSKKVYYHHEAEISKRVKKTLDEVLCKKKTSWSWIENEL